MFLIVGVIFGVICAVVANSKGRSVVAWLLLGFLFGLFSLIILLLLSDLKKEQAERDYSEQERRRLREQLRQEKLKNEAFRQHAAARLDMHDRQLGVDTRATGGQLGYDPNQQAQGQLPYNPNAPQVFQPEGAYNQQPTYQAANAGQIPGTSTEPRWYFEKEGRTEGPIAQGTLLTLLRTGAVPPHTLVCSEQLGQWVAAFDVPELRRVLPS